MRMRSPRGFHLSIIWIQALLVVVLADGVVLASSSSANSVSSKQQQQQQHSHHHHGPNNNTPSCTGVPTVPSHRKACGFYVWDVPSALFYKWCHHLLKDHLYEGKGGHMFVRYESNSILQLLYPCSRYSPNSCFVCGGNYNDHLELWWSKHLYTPFDLHLDKTYQEALTLHDDDGSNNHYRGGGGGGSLSSQNNNYNIGAFSSPLFRRGRQNKPKYKKRKGFPKQPPVEVVKFPTFAFHKRYVQDVSHLLKDDTPIREQWQHLKQRLTREHRRRQKQQGYAHGDDDDDHGNNNSNMEGWTLTRYPRYGVSYVLPKMQKEGESSPRNVFLMMARTWAQDALDNLIIFQEKENAKLRP